MENENSHTGGKIFGVLLVIIIVIVISWFALQQGFPEQAVQEQQTVEELNEQSQEQALAEAAEEVEQAAEEVQQVEQELESAEGGEAMQDLPTEVLTAQERTLRLLDPAVQSAESFDAAQKIVDQIAYASLKNPALVRYKWASTNVRQAREARAYTCTNQFFAFEREAIEALAFLSCVPMENGISGGSVTYDRSVVAFRKEDTSKYAPAYLIETPGFLDCPAIPAAEEAMRLLVQSEEQFVVHAMQQECVEEKARVDAERALQLGRNAAQEQQYLKASWNYRNAWNYVRACQC